MIQRIIKDMSILLASALWGIMTFLQIPVILELKCSNFSSSKQFHNIYKGFPHLKAAEFTTLEYDNIFLWAFGIFLITYILTLKSINADQKRTKDIRASDKRKINLVLYILLFMSVGYIISDWWENYLLCQIMSRNNVEVIGFPYLKIIKWLLALTPLVACLIIDKKYFKNNFNISYREIMCLGIVMVVVGVLFVNIYISGFLAKIDAIKCFAMSTLFN